MTTGLKEDIRLLVQSIMDKNDSSHDINHIDRVVKMALFLAKEEKIEDPILLENIELAALLHDINDSKYITDETSITKICIIFDKYSISYQRRDYIFWIVNNIGYQKELKRVGRINDIGYRIVSDADILDALGAIGIARCLFFSATHGGVIHDPENKRSAIRHFHDKLFHLKNMMKTDKGKILAQEKTEIMRIFVSTLENEWK